jgi:uridine phosphorylase
MIQRGCNAKRDEDSAVVEPRKGKREEALPSSAILIFTPRDLELFIGSFPTPPIRSHKAFLVDIFTGSYLGKPVALAGPMLGAPQTILVLEKMIALGVRTVIAVGWCGSLQEHVRIGDVLLPVETVSEEGTSWHYPLHGPSPGPSPRLLDRLRQSLYDGIADPHQGKVWSTDAPYRETKGKVLSYQKAGVLAVDMESSALFTVAGFRKIDLAVVLTVSDELFTLDWVHGFKNPRFLETRKRLVEPILIQASGGQVKDGDTP